MRHRFYTRGPENEAKKPLIFYAVAYVRSHASSIKQFSATNLFFTSEV